MVASVWAVAVQLLMSLTVTVKVRNPAASPVTVGFANTLVLIVPGPVQLYV